MPLRLNSSSLTYSICALAAIILQLVAMECQKPHTVDSPILPCLLIQLSENRQEEVQEPHYKYKVVHGDEVKNIIKMVDR